MKRLAAVWGVVLAAVMLSGAVCGPNTDSVVTPPVAAEGRDLFQQGERFFEAGDYQTALVTFEQVQKKYPNSPLAITAEMRIGECYFKLADNPNAIVHLQNFVSRAGSNSDLTAAQGLIIRIQDAELIQLRAERDALKKGSEQKLARLELMNQSLRRTVDSEVLYLEMDLGANRLYVKMGTQALYEYPIVSGKGETTMRLTGGSRDFDTPVGVRRIENIEKDPIWYRPDWYWTEKGLPIPAGLTMEERAVPGTLGPYKLSFGEGFFIHGTRTGSINPGKFSHGCVRMNNKDLLQLVTMVEVGTMIYIY